MRVLFPFVGDSVGGSHNSILELYYCLNNEKGVYPLIVLHNLGKLSNFLDELKIPYQVLPANNLAGETPNFFRIFIGILKNFIVIQKFIRKNNIDIVHGNDLRINLTWSIPSRLLGRVSYVWHQRTTLSKSPLWCAIFFMGDYFVTISNNVHKTIPNNIPLLKQDLVFNPFNIDIKFDKEESRNWVNSLYDIPKDAILFGYIGRLIDWKNVDLLLGYFSKFLLASSDNVYLLIVGTGEIKYIEKLKDLVTYFGISERVVFAGFSSKSSKIISSLDLLVSASNNEPFGRTIIEAMLQKTPVLVTNGGGHSETVEDIVTGYLYAHEDADDFLEKCQRFIEDSVERNKITDCAYNQAISKFSSSTHAKKIIRIYRGLVSY